MAIHNTMEEIVFEVLDPHKHKLKLNCDCQQCMDDIMAISLNSLPPHYVARDENTPFARVPYLTNRQSSINVLAAVTKAVGIVTESPRCK